MKNILALINIFNWHGHTKQEPKLFRPKPYGNARRYFYEGFNQKAFNKATGLNVSFVQDVHSLRSEKGEVRGLYYQDSYYAQDKLVRVIEGRVFEVVVDIRQSSATFGKWYSVELSEENGLQLWIPKGFAHGFLVLSDFAQLQYKTTDYWQPEQDKCIRWTDRILNIDWPLVDGKKITRPWKDVRGVDFRGKGGCCVPRSKGTKLIYEE